MRSAYDRVASAYDDAIGHELDAKPLDRALLSAFTELAGGVVADIGCGPGHVTRYLEAGRHPVLGIDLSTEMARLARRHDPRGAYAVGSMLDLPLATAVLAGAAVLYSIIHFSADERARAWHELARAVRPGGWLLVAFHVDSHEYEMGAVNHLTEWFGHPVELDGHFLDPDPIERALGDAGFSVRSRTVRQPSPAEYPSRRCLILAQRSA